jgi:hypothetical protein
MGVNAPAVHPSMTFFPNLCRRVAVAASASAFRLPLRSPLSARVGRFVAVQRTVRFMLQHGLNCSVTCFDQMSTKVFTEDHDWVASDGKVPQLQPNP